MDKMKSGRSKAAVYLRASTADQHVESQLYDLRELAVQLGLDVVQEYRDSGVSGKRARRPGLDALIADARQKKFSGVLVAAFDRVARSVKHFLQVMDEFDSLGIVFISRRENVDTSGPMGTSLSNADWLDCRTGVGLDPRTCVGWHAKGEARRGANGTRTNELGSCCHRPRPTQRNESDDCCQKVGRFPQPSLQLVKRAGAGDEGSVLPPACIVDSVHVLPSSSSVTGRILFPSPFEPNFWQCSQIPLGFRPGQVQVTN
jgi:hypothetical protein